MKIRNSVLFSALFLFAACAVAEPPVAINGVLLSADDVASLEARLGGRVVPGSYAYDPTTGCWANLSVGTSGCLGSDTVTTFGRYGSGERNSNGVWSYNSDIAGGSVGGTGDGCVYAFDWSNC